MRPYILTVVVLAILFIVACIFTDDEDDEPYTPSAEELERMFR